MIAADFAFIDTSQSQSMCSKICNIYTEFLIKKICCRQSSCALQGYNREVIFEYGGIMLRIGVDLGGTNIAAGLCAMAMSAKLRQSMYLMR